MKKLSLKLDDLAVDSFAATNAEKSADGTVQAYATLDTTPCWTQNETCRSCNGTCPRPCEV